MGDGRGASLPLVSNETPRGRALNRRIEVEFSYDDPLQELPDEPQLCPGAAGESDLEPRQRGLRLFGCTFDEQMLDVERQALHQRRDHHGTVAAGGIALKTHKAGAALVGEFSDLAEFGLRRR